MSDKPHLPKEKTEKATQQLTTRDISSSTKPIKISSVLRGGTSVIDTQISKDTKLSVTVRMGQEEIPMCIKSALSHQVNIIDSIIVKRSNDICDGGLIRHIGVECKGDKMCRIES